jgi:hypothetical protein
MYRRRHDNAHVAATDAALRRVGSRWKADVDVKQRVADVLDIDSLGLSGGDRWYALSSHFDFVVWRDNHPQFAVEFDERHHFTDSNQVVRDEKKNHICDKAAFPLLRVEEASLKRIGTTSVMEWLADLWFVYHDLWLPARCGWDEAEDYDPDDWDDDLYAEVREHDHFDYTKFMSGVEARGIPEFSSFSPYDPFWDARHTLTVRGFDGRHLDTPAWWRWSLPFEAFRESDPYGRDVGHVAVPVGPEGVVIGTGRCWNPSWMFLGNPLIGSQIAVDLAVQQAAEFLELYDRGKVPAVSWEEAGRELAHLKHGLLQIARLSQHDHREMSYRYLRRMGMPHDPALHQAYSLKWDEDGEPVPDDDFW